MRIRKHAKISSLLNATSSAATLTPHICQLNQSRWDVMSLSPPSTPTPPPPPPPPQVDRDCFSAGNGSSNHSILASQSEFKVGQPQEEYSGDFAATDKAEQPKTEQIILCSKTDGKSWQCRREAAKGNSLCEHHLSLIKSYNLANSTTKKPESGRRPRPKKVSSDPHEYYYYSGFGPRWGKKRGENRKNNGSNEVKKLERETELHTSMPSRVEDEEFSYIEDDDDDDEESRENGKKRARKPIKARSLKSLM